jgi:hypothetical protein
MYRIAREHLVSIWDMLVESKKGIYRNSERICDGRHIFPLSDMVYSYRNLCNFSAITGTRTHMLVNKLQITNIASLQIVVSIKAWIHDG